MFYKKGFLTIFLTGLLLVSVVFSGCGTKQYRGNAGEVKYEFRVPAKTTVFNSYVYGTFQRDPLIPDAGLAKNTIIYFSTFKSLQLSKDLFIERIDELKQINSYILSQQNIQTINISGQPAKYFEYAYDGYTTMSIRYVGVFLSFTYNDVVFEVDIITLGDLSETYNTFQMFVDSFKLSK